MPPGPERVKRSPQVFTNTPNLVVAKQGIAQIPVTVRTLFSASQSQPHHLGRFPQNAEALPDSESRAKNAARTRISLKACWMACTGDGVELTCLSATATGTQGRQECLPHERGYLPCASTAATIHAGFAARSARAAS